MTKMYHIVLDMMAIEDSSKIYPQNLQQVLMLYLSTDLKKMKYSVCLYASVDIKQTGYVKYC